jgi:predicted DNA-binding transcriptional regulator YafY
MSKKINEAIFIELPNVLKRLIGGQKINTKYEANTLEVSERTFRDNFFKIIKPILGKDLNFDRSTNSWYLIKDAHINSTLVTPEEMVHIRKLEMLSEKYHKNFPKLKDIFTKYREMSSDAIYKKYAHEILDEKGLAKYKIIQQSILDNSVVFCTYKNKARIIHPLKIINLNGSWYVGVYEILENSPKEYKNFILTSIENIIVDSNRFKAYGKTIDRRLDSAVNAFFSIDKKEVQIVLEMDSRFIAYFRRKKISPNQKITRSTGDYWFLKLTVTDIHEILPTVQQFLPHIKVIEPKELQDEVIKNVQNYCLESSGNISCPKCHTNPV